MFVLNVHNLADPLAKFLFFSLVSGHQINQCCEQRTLSVFNNLVENPGCNDMVAELLNNKYILPGKSCFYMVLIRFVFLFCFVFLLLFKSSILMVVIVSFFNHVEV